MAAEAIIISGPRTGEFITVKDDLPEEPPQAVIEDLGRALRNLDAAVVAILEDARAWRSALREPREAAANG